MAIETTLGLFEGYGIELEYAMVDQDQLNIAPLADQLLGDGQSEVDHPPLAWSNELVMHVIELKNPAPVSDIASLEPAFNEQVASINRQLNHLTTPHCLLPTGAHPWMDPTTETRLWPHEQTEIYHTYHRIFSTRGHGWANLQSCHLNLSFANDDDFFRLHTAIRVLLPLLPGLTASTPYLSGTFAAAMDARLETYAINQHQIPEIAGQIVPEQIGSIQEYHDRILKPMYRAIAPLDSDGILQEEWLNSRGAIPKFSRSSMEIRILDLQANPSRDILYSLVIIALLRRIALLDTSDLHALGTVPQDVLVSQYRRCVGQASGARLTLPYISTLFMDILPRSGGTDTTGGGKGLSDAVERVADTGHLRVRDFWTAVLGWFAENQQLSPGLSAELQTCLRTYPEQGSLAESLYATLGPAPSRSELAAQYRLLADQLPGARGR